MQNVVFTLLTLIISFTSIAQIYIKGPNNDSYKKLGVEKEHLDGLAKTLYKAYNKRIKSASVYIPDSLHFVITTDFEGRFGAVLYHNEKSAKNASAIINEVKKVNFKAPGQYSFSVVYPKVDQQIVPIWLMQNPPNLAVCTMYGSNGNLVYRRSCFNYFVQKRLIELETPPIEDKGKLDGYIGASISISERGRVLMVEFDSLSVNPKANDFFAERLKGVKFPGGGMHNGKQMAYSVDVKDQFYGSAELMVGHSDTLVESTMNLLTFNTYDGTFEPIGDYQVDTTFQSIKTLLAFQESNYKFTLRKDSVKPIMGSFLILLGGRYKGKIQTGVLTPPYDDRKSDAIFPAVFTACKQSRENSEYASTCTSAKLIEQLCETFDYSYIMNSWVGSLSKQVFVVNHLGNVERIQVVGGNYLPAFDLKIMYDISNTPKMTPGSIDGVNRATIFTVLGLL